MCKFRLLIWDLSLSFFAMSFSCYMKFSRQYLSCQYYPVKPKYIHKDFTNFNEVFLSQVFLRVSITHKAAENYVNLLLHLFKCFLHMKIRLLLWKETNDESQPPQFRPLGTKAGSWGYFQDQLKPEVKKLKTATYETYEKWSTSSRL